MTHANWICPKCKHKEFEVNEMRASGGALSAMFDVSNRKFATVTCTQCQYTEFYRTDSDSIEQALDFLAP